MSNETPRQGTTKGAGVEGSTTVNSEYRCDISSVDAQCIQSYDETDGKHRRPNDRAPILPIYQPDHDWADPFARDNSDDRSNRSTSLTNSSSPWFPPDELSKLTLDPSS